jgi:hypothetical protein
LVFNGTNYVPATAAVSEIDGIIGNEIQDVIVGGGLVRTGTGTDIDPYKVGLPMTGSSNQMLIYNGIQWNVTSLIGGDISGNPNSLIVNGIRGINIDNIIPTIDQALVFNGTTYTPTSIITTSNANTINHLGDVTGNHSNTKVEKIQGISVTNTIPTNGQSLIFNGTSYIFETPLLESTNFSGDISGTYNSLVIDGIQGVPIVGTPTNGQSLVFNGTQWVPATISLSEVDGVIGNEIQDIITGGGLVRSGTGTSLDPYKVGLPMTATLNQSLYFNGIQWTVGNIIGGDISGNPGSITVTKLNNILVDNTTPVNNTFMVFDGVKYTTALADGDISGQYDNITVKGIRGINVTNTSPITNDILIYNGTQYTLSNFNNLINTDGNVITGNGSIANKIRISNAFFNNNILPSTPSVNVPLTPTYQSFERECRISLKSNKLSVSYAHPQFFNNFSSSQPQLTIQQYDHTTDSILSYDVPKIDTFAFPGSAQISYMQKINGVSGDGFYSISFPFFPQTCSYQFFNGSGQIEATAIESATITVLSPAMIQISGSTILSPGYLVMTAISN